MGRRHLAGLAASAALAALLLLLLFRMTGIDLSGVGQAIAGVRPAAFAAIVLVLAANTVLSGEKWRLIARRLQRGGDSGMPRLLYFAFTSIGVALGQILPAQLSL